MNRKSKRNNPDKPVRRSPRLHPGSTPGTNGTDPKAPPATPPATKTTTKSTVGGDRIKAILDQPDPTKEEKEEKALVELKKCFRMLHEKYDDIDGDDLLKVLMERGHEDLFKVLENLRDPEDDSFEGLERLLDITSAYAHLNTYVMCCRPPLKVEGFHLLSGNESPNEPPTEPPTSFLAELTLECAEAAKEKETNTLLLVQKVQQVQRDLAEMKQTQAAQGKDIAAIKEKFEAETKAIWAAIKKLQDEE